MAAAIGTAIYYHRVIHPLHILLKALLIYQHLCVTFHAQLSKVKLEC